VPYPAGHRIAKRETIVQSARKLFNRYGFDNVSLKQIMAGAGLTHGGFYSYFKCKSDLYTEVLDCFFTNPKWKSRWKGLEVDLCSADAGQQIVRAYLSRQHFDNVENCCPMVALPSDVRRSDKNVRGAFETVFAAMVNALEGSLKNERGSRHAKAQAIAALCVGGMVLARAMNNGAIADDLRDACMAVALELGHWNDGNRGTRAGAKRPQRLMAH
jgi:TetR/AcrR family transcriptional regulator, transcriptional repressor for nem operon